MSSGSTVLATMSTNQSAWAYTLVAGLVVLLVVVALLEGLRRAVRKLDRDIWTTWVTGKAVVAHTATTYLLKNTRDSADELVDELAHHG
jgi:galactitol-specific phosphotransferase system IIC component